MQLASGEHDTKVNQDMKVTVLFFAHCKEATGKSEYEMVVEGRSER